MYACDYVTKSVRMHKSYIQSRDLYSTH